MAMTDVQLCSSALLKIGATAIPSFAATSVEAEIARTLYPLTLDGLLSAHPWSFTLAQAALSPAAVPPVADFSHAFTLPADMLRAVSAGSGERGRGLVYRLFGRTLVANATGVVLTYQRRPAEADLPAFFAQALIDRLAAEFCMPLTENGARTTALFDLAAISLRQARLLDSQQSTPQAVEDFTLIDARA